RRRAGAGRQRGAHDAVRAARADQEPGVGRARARGPAALARGPARGRPHTRLPPGLPPRGGAGPPGARPDPHREAPMRVRLAGAALVVALLAAALLVAVELGM